MFLGLYRWARQNIVGVCLCVLLLCQLSFLAVGSLGNSFVLSETEDYYALQGKDPSAPGAHRDPLMAGKQNISTGSSQAGGIPVAFGENAPAALSARAGGVKSEDNLPKLLAAKYGDVGAAPGSEGNGGLPGSDGNGGKPGAEGNGGKPGAEGNSGMPGPAGNIGKPGPEGNGGMPGFNGSTGQPGSNGSAGMTEQGSQALAGAAGTSGVGSAAASGTGSTQSVANSANSATGSSLGKAVKAANGTQKRVQGQPQQQMNTIDSGMSYERGLRIIYYLEKRGGKYALNAEQARYVLSLISQMEEVRQHDMPKPVVEPVLVAAEAHNSGNELTVSHKERALKVGIPKADKASNDGAGQDDGGKAYHNAFLLLYALEAKGGKYALSPEQARHILRLVDEAESCKSVVPDAQKTLPRILTPEQLSYIRSQLSAAAAEGKRTEPSLLNSYAQEVMRLTE